MRRIKTYVMTVGVALSVAPIFNSAFAQQGNNSTQLLLQVQTMRQEIAELRDMVERQGFQLRRLQKQVEAQSNQFEPGQGFDNRTPNNIGQPSYNNAAGQNSARIESQSGTQAGLSSSQVNGSVAQVGANTGEVVDAGQRTNWNVENTPGVQQNSGNVYRPNTPNSQGVASAANQNAYTGSQSNQTFGQAGSSNKPPVVDRSFSTPNSAVPVTGAGTRQQQAVGGFQDARSSQLPSDQGAYNQQAPNQEYQARAQGAVTSTANGVISVPSQAGTVVNQAPINASQIPSAPVATSTGIPQSAANNPTTQVASAQTPAVVSEDDYYAQGFELLKQSKYEEAASIFEQQLQAHPRGELADDAHYWIAEAMHVSRKLDVAKVHLKAIIRDYPQSRRLPDAMLKTAYIEQSQGNQIEARMLFQEIVNQHPQSDAAIAAKNQLAAVN